MSKKIRFLDLGLQNGLVGEEILELFERTLRSASFIGGKELVAFERAFEAFLSKGLASHEKAFVIPVGNGTDALEICMESLPLKEEANVLVPANSFFATSEAVVRAGHNPIFCDVDEQTGVLSVESMKKIGSSIQIDAVICVHLYGQPCPMTEILDFCAESKILLIEDCAQAHGAEYRGQRVGTFGNAAAFSFYPGKNLGGIGDGGAVVTKTQSVARQARLISNHGRVNKYEHLCIGRNSRLDNINAGILAIKLNRLPYWLERRAAIAARYRRGLNGCTNITLFETSDNTFHSNHLFVVKTEWREELREFLHIKGVETGLHYPIALHKLPAHSNINSDSQNHSLDISERLASRVLSLPMGEHLSDNDIDSVINYCLEFDEKKDFSIL